MQRAEVQCPAHTPSLLQDLGTELSCFSHPQKAKLLFSSLDYYFLSQIKENKNERERKKTCDSLQFLCWNTSALVTGTWFFEPTSKIYCKIKLKLLKTTRLNDVSNSLLICICECRTRLQAGSRVGLETWVKLSSCEIFRQILQTTQTTLAGQASKSVCTL